MTTAARFLALPLAERAACLTPDTWGRVDSAPLPPYGVEIQPTAHCHRTCLFCSHIIRNRRGGELSAAEVDAVLDECEAMGVARIAFSGGGEPLYWAAGDLTAAIRRAAGFAEVSLTASGDQLLDAGSLHPDAPTLLEHCVTMYFNIPAVDERNFARQVRGPSGWAHASAMLRALVTLRASDPQRFRCRLHAVVVLSALNVDQIAGIDRTLFEHGIDAVYYKQWKNFEARNVRRVRLEDDHILEVLTAIPAAERSADLDAFLAQLSATYPGQHCWSNRIANDMIIDPNGDVFLCTPTVGKVEFSIGNLDDGSLTDLWLGAERFRQLRVLDDMSAGGRCPSHCRHHPDNARLDAMISSRDA